MYLQLTFCQKKKKKLPNKIMVDRDYYNPEQQFFLFRFDVTNYIICITIYLLLTTLQYHWIFPILS